MTQNRKRGRNVHEEEMEFMPLSKRINNLHINGSLLVCDTSVNLLENTQWGPGPPCINSSIQRASVNECIYNTESNRVPRYNPELSEIQNPHYFSMNKLLFEMYIERSQRNGQSFEI